MKSLVPTWEKINKLGRTMVLAAQEDSAGNRNFPKGSSVCTELICEGDSENKGLSNWARG